MEAPPCRWHIALSDVRLTLGAVMRPTAAGVVLSIHVRIATLLHSHSRVSSGNNDARGTRTDEQARAVTVTLPGATMMCAD